MKTTQAHDVIRSALELGQITEPQLVARQAAALASCNLDLSILERLSLADQIVAACILADSTDLGCVDELGL